MRIVIGLINGREKNLKIGGYSFDEYENYLTLYDENDKIINVMTIPELMEVLTKYCKGEK